MPKPIALSFPESGSFSYQLLPRQKLIGKVAKADRKSGKSYSYWLEKPIAFANGVKTYRFRYEVSKADRKNGNS